MRILAVCSSWRVFGAEIITLKLLEGLKANGHSVQAVTSTWTDGEFNRRLTALNIPDVQLPLGVLSKQLAWRPMRWTAAALLRAPKLWWGFRRLLREFRPDVVIHTSNRHTIWLFPWLAGRPTFLIEHTHLEPT